MTDAVVRRFRDALPADLDFCSLRLVSTRSESLSIRKGVLQPLHDSEDLGAMVTVRQGRGLGYAATADLSTAGLVRAIARARAWAERTAAQSVFDYSRVVMPEPTGSWRSPVAQPWDGESLAQRLERVRAAAASLPNDDRLVEWEVALDHTLVETRLVTSGGGDVTQVFDMVSPDATVVAHAEGRTQTRSLGLRGHSQQGGLEIADKVDFTGMPGRLAADAMSLLSAPDCPSGEMDLLLAPDQMMLQIHESIGHPLELDRILGDERNYAGTSFVSLDMFGSYRYGSELLNVSFDPGVPGELAGYAWDDDGTPAERQMLIRAGILERGLGGVVSQARAGVPGVSCTRAASWNRPPIDRMANLNVEPGDSSFTELVSRVERGVLMRTNTSWSIDDSRNKFQFGCEWGQLIEDGELKGVVRNPNYRGVSESFWRNLVGVGDRSTFEVWGTPYCGKGEPNQLARVGHAAPFCLFAGVDVFGGA